jgi:iron(III) transport system substrate-binding protein
MQIGKFGKLALAACVAGLLGSASAKAADQALIDAAKKEGEVVWYSTLIVDQLVRPVAAAFEEKYGIPVQFSRTPAGEMALKVQNEIRANSVQVDVFDANAAFFQVLPLDDLESYVPEAAAAYPADLKDPDGRYYSVNVFTMTTGINTELVAEDEYPKIYEDLLDPKWKGRMAWTTDLTPNGPPGFIGNILMTMGEEKGMEYLRALAKQDIAKIPASQRVVLDQVISGEYAIGLMIFNHHAVISADKGAPVTWLKIEPVVSTSNYAGIIKGAPHPNAAKLFLDFLLSNEGQNVFRDANYLPASPSVQAKVPDLKPADGGYTATVITNQLALEDLPKWSAVYKELFD